MRIDAKNDDAAAELAAIPETDGYQKELARMLWVGAHNNTNFGGFGADHRLEWKNGGMSMEIMQVEGSTAYALLTNIGGEFEPGDRILFDMSHHDQNVDLFEIPVPEQLEQELVIELDGESGPDDRFCWQTATISPISFQLDGIYGSGETSNEAVSITLKDGISFALSSAENGYEDSPYGTYGSWGSSYAGSWESNRGKEYMAVLARFIGSGRAGLRHRVRRDVPCFTIKTTQNDIIGIHASQISISNLLPGMLN